MAFERPARNAPAAFVLTSNITHWLQAIAVLSGISLVVSVGLLLVIGFKLVSWQLRSKKTSQFVLLIFNLLLADIQQALAFLLNLEWLRRGAIPVQSRVCFAQGWLVSTGDLGSGIWCFAIATHTLASVIFNYRLPPRYFYLTIGLLWIFNYAVSCVGVTIHGHHLYDRSGVWCWIDAQYRDLRLWTHYIWIFIFEFGNIVIYALIYLFLLRRIHSGYYSPAEARRVKSISNLMVVYPLVYVVCTLPLASARMAAMSGHPPSYARLALSGAIITSNGWLDVLLYTCTRKIMILSENPPADDNGVDTFSTFWVQGSNRFGVHCHVEALHARQRSRGGFSGVRSKGPLPKASESSDDLCSHGGKNIKLTTTTQLISEPATQTDFDVMEVLKKMRQVNSPSRWSSESFDSRPPSLMLHDTCESLPPQ